MCNVVSEIILSLTVLNVKKIAVSSGKAQFISRCRIVIVTPYFIDSEYQSEA